MDKKGIILTQRRLADEEVEIKCELCSLKKSCTSNLRSYLTASEGFLPCALGYVYDIERIDYAENVAKHLPEPSTLEEALNQIEILKDINSIQHLAIHKQKDFLKNLGEIDETLF